ncbi:39S ribosomal protein L9, mitochondrial [Centropristis striata]|uniref:39S ribosomal protein L9, mitochondrial n=1 Tax=Centropristis striata TaxID=184440 RepID=UPI0027E08029|nr:39S ribosomal protein L9, mitochondrial [Centropristis striata]
MWSSTRRVLQELFTQPAARRFSLSPAQNTVVVERWWQVPLAKVGGKPKLHPRRHRIYRFVEDTKCAPKEKMELILTQTVPRLGGRGDTVFVKKSVGRNKLLPEGLAVYPSPENKEMFAEELKRLREGRPEDRIQTRTGQLTVERLKQCKVKIMKMPADDFQVNKEVVSRHFQKKLGAVVPPHTLTLPFESVTELGDYWCEVTVNGIDTVRIPLSVVPYVDMSLKYRWLQKLQRQHEQEVAAGTSESVAEEEEAAVKAVSDAEAGKDSVSPVTEASAEPEASAEASAEPETAASSQTSQETTAPSSDSPKKE